MDKLSCDMYDIRYKIEELKEEVDFYRLISNEEEVNTLIEEIESILPKLQIIDNFQILGNYKVRFIYDNNKTIETKSKILYNLVNSTVENNRLRYEVVDQEDLKEKLLECLERTKVFIGFNIMQYLHMVQYIDIGVDSKLIITYYNKYGGERYTIDNNSLREIFLKISNYKNSPVKLVNY